MINNYIKNLLDKCNQAYSNGEFYTLTEDDCYMLDNILDVVVNKEEVTDEMYDIIYNTAKEKWPEDQYFDKLTSDNTGYGIDVIHEFPMGSMEELKEGELEKWTKGHNTFTISDKLDGCSLVLTYEYGKLKVAATRGHGIKGKDVTRHINFVPNVPKEIKYNDKIIIRGELLFKKNNIESIMNQVELLTGKRPRNGRNTIAGLLTRKESYEDLLKQTYFVAYWTSTDFGRSFKVLENLGFTVPFYDVLSTETLTDMNMIELVKTRIKYSDYELDGIIITQNDNIEEGFVGSTINPKCSRKFKLGIYDNIAESTVTNINWQISRWGVFTPVLEIKPVDICGCTVSNITAHNYANVIETKCGIGAKIKFIRAGLVIPKLEEVLKPSENYNLPKCATKVEGVDLVFDEDNPYSENLFKYTREKDIQALEYFGKKLEIEQLGYGSCAKLYDAFLSEDYFLTPVDLLLLDNDIFISIIGKNGEKLVKSFNKVKENLTEVLFASACGLFGPGLGERVLQPIFDQYNTLNVTKEQLEVLEGFGESRINQYLLYLTDYLDALEYIKENGINFFKKEQIQTSSNLNGCVVCFTGVRDKDFAKYINMNGGQAIDSWRKDVTHLVVKDLNSTSSKMKKAQEKNCIILTLEEAKKEFKYE